MQSKMDLTCYPYGYREYGGSDSKFSLLIDGEHCLVKRTEYTQPTYENSAGLVSSPVSEYVGSHIMQSLGIDTHETFLCKYHDKENRSPKEDIVVACRDFTDENYRLQHFRWFMLNMYSRNEIGRVPTYGQLYHVMETHPVLEKITEQAISRYWDQFIGDALIGNPDRHKENFGYLVNEKTGDIRLAPVYDCGSSLFPSLDEEGLEKVLSSKEEIEKRCYTFPTAALTPPGGGKTDKTGYFDFISSGYDRNCTEAFLRIYEKIDLKQINRIIDETPYISDIRKEFYKTMIVARKELILDRSIEELLKKGAIVVDERHDRDEAEQKIGGGDEEPEL